MIYLDNAATSLQKPEEVEEEMIRALHTMGNPGRGADRKSTRLNSSHRSQSRMPSSA